MIYWVTTIVHYKPRMITIDAAGLVKIIINMIVRYHGLSMLIGNDEKLKFTLKFWFLLYHFFGIKQKLCTKFYS